MFSSSRLSGCVELKRLLVVVVVVVVDDVDDVDDDDDIGTAQPRAARGACRRSSVLRVMTRDNMLCSKIQKATSE